MDAITMLNLVCNLQKKTVIVALSDRQAVFKVWWLKVHYQRMGSV